MAHLANTWNPADFMHEILAEVMKPGRLHEIQQISWQGLIYTAYPEDLYWFWWKIQHQVDFTMKSGRFHAWNLADFMHEIRQISGPEIWWILMHEIQWISYANCLIRIWNLADFMMKSSGFHPWNQVDFMADHWKMQTFFITLMAFFYVNQISNSLAMDSLRLSLWPGSILSSLV